MYSLVESAKAAGVDPLAYLVEVTTRAKQNPGAVLLPADFKVPLISAISARSRPARIRRPGNQARYRPPAPTGSAGRPRYM